MGKFKLNMNNEHWIDIPNLFDQKQLVTLRLAPRGGLDV